MIFIVLYLFLWVHYFLEILIFVESLFEFLGSFIFLGSFFLFFLRPLYDFFLDLHLRFLCVWMKVTIGEICCECYSDNVYELKHSRDSNDFKTLTEYLSFFNFYIFLGIRAVWGRDKCARLVNVRCQNIPLKVTSLEVNTRFIQ